MTESDEYEQWILWHFYLPIPLPYQSSVITLKTKNFVAITVARKTGILELTGRGRTVLKLPKRLKCGRFMESPTCSFMFILTDSEFIFTARKWIFCLWEVCFQNKQDQLLNIAVSWDSDNHGYKRRIQPEDLKGKVAELLCVMGFKTSRIFLEI